MFADEPAAFPMNQHNTANRNSQEPGRHPPHAVAQRHQRAGSKFVESDQPNDGKTEGDAFAGEEARERRDAAIGDPHRRMRHEKYRDRNAHHNQRVRQRDEGVASIRH